MSRIRADGHREMLAVQVADTESEATDQDLFRDLKERGLTGGPLVPSDDHPGLRAAMARHFPGASWQPCQGPCGRHRRGQVAGRDRATLGVDLTALFGAARAAQTRTLAGEIADRWRVRHPALAERLETDLEPGLAGSAFPAAHRSRLRTTHGVDRLNQDLTRRTWVGRIFPKRASLFRLVTALAREQSEAWISGRRYLDMESLTAAAADEPAAGAAPLLAPAAA